MKSNYTYASLLILLHQNFDSSHIAAIKSLYKSFTLLQHQSKLHQVLKDNMMNNTFY